MTDQHSHGSLTEPSDETIARMEDKVMTAISAHPRRRPSRVMPKLLMAAAAVALVASGAVIGGIMNSGNTTLSMLGSSTEMTDEFAEAPSDTYDMAQEEAGDATGLSTMADGQEVLGGDSDRSIIVAGGLQLRVSDVSESADRVGVIVERLGGRVESLNTFEDAAGDSGSRRYGYVTVRVPSAEVDALITEVSDLGTVMSRSIDRSDVTEQVSDLEARIGAAQTSVDRLLELMAEANTTSDLLQAEESLAQRQQELESLLAQQKFLSSQVSEATISIDLVEEGGTVTAEPGGFFGGLLAGWNALVGFLNFMVIAVGAVLPWAGTVAVLVGFVWLIVWLRRRRSRSRS